MSNIARSNPAGSMPAKPEDLPRNLHAPPQPGADAAEITALFEEQADAIYNYCYRRTASWHEAEDLTAQVFFTAWKSRHKGMAYPGSMVPWLYGIANNTCRAHQRATKRRLKLLRQSAHELAPAGGRDPALWSADHERLRAALDRLETLPESHQEVFFLVCWQGLNYADCAAALDLPIGTVRSRLSRVRAELRFHDKDSTHD